MNRYQIRVAIPQDSRRSEELYETCPLYGSVIDYTANRTAWSPGELIERSGPHVIRYPARNLGVRIYDLEDAERLETRLPAEIQVALDLSEETGLVLAEDLDQDQDPTRSDLP